MIVRGRWLIVLTIWALGVCRSAAAQSPNTAAVVIVVHDQSGAVVTDADVRLANSATGERREAVSGGDGTATFTALAIAGVYNVQVEKSGFSPVSTPPLVLRAGETATVRVTLVAAGGDAVVTVYGTTTGIRTDLELGVRLDSESIDETPVLGRKVSALPLLNASFRPAKGTGDLFLNSVYFVTGAGGRRQPDFVVDGATGNEPWGRQTMFATIPVAAVQEMNVMSRAFSAEFGWTSSAGINVVTKSGTNETRGEAVVLGRPGGLQATTFGPERQCPPDLPSCVVPIAGGSPIALVPPDIPDSLAQGSFAIGGAIVPDATHYFVAADVTHQDRTAPITSPLVPAGTTVVGEFRQLLVDARLDHRFSGAHSAMARVNVDRFYDTNPQDAVSGNVLPSAGRRFERHAYAGQVNFTSILSSSLLNEARVEYQHAEPVTAFDPLTPSTQYTRAGLVPFTAGESRYAHVFSHLGQVSDTITLTRGAHDVRLGGNIARHVSGGDGTEFGSAFVLGQFTVNPTSTAPIGEITLADIQRYQQSFNLGISSYELAQWMYAAFAQDRIRVGPHLTVDAGARYDRQTFSDGHFNLAPRLGFNWQPGDADVSVRGGFGVYYTQLRSNLDASFELGGPLGVFTYTAVPGQGGFPACLTCAPVVFDPGAAARTLPARNITIRPGRAAYYEQFFDVGKLTGYSGATFVNPKSQVASIGIERRLAERLIASVDYVKQHWTGLDRTVDLNAPSLFARTAPGQVRPVAAADLTRPIVPANGGFRQINVIENLGVADYDGLQTTLRWQSARAMVAGSYTLSSATNTTEPDGNAAGPNDYSQLGEIERGPSVLDQRHRGVVSASYRLPANVTIGGVLSAASARPFNATTGLDNNGDGVNNDRPVVDGKVVSRYDYRGTSTRDLALFGELRWPTGGRRSILFRLEAFNVLNDANVLGRNGIYGDAATPLPTFGQATPGLTSIESGRMVQFQVRFAF